GSILFLAVIAAVGGQPRYLDLEERWTVAAPTTSYGLPRGAVHLQHVAAVDRDAGHRVSGRPRGHVVYGHLLVLRHRNSIPIVLDHEHHRQPMYAGEVERLMEVPLARRPFTERGQTHLTRPAQLCRKSDAVGMQELRGHRTAGGEDLVARVPVVAG